MTVSSRFVKRADYQNTRTLVAGRCCLPPGWVLSVGIWILSSGQAAIGADVPAVDAGGSESDAPERVIRYGERGLEFQRGETDLWAGLRFQTRIDSHPGDMVAADDLAEALATDLELRRGRIKGGGTLFREWLDVYTEYNFPSTTWLDYRATVTVAGWLHIRAGQWKADFNRERVDSSGKQQLVERSISTYWFTVDRQRGLSTSARFGKGSAADTSVWVEALSGHGRGGTFGDDKSLLVVRLQWNPAGEVLPFSQADLARRQTPLSSLALAYAGGDTAYTRFSTDGGGSLPGFNEGDFELEQWLFESAFHYRGLGWQQELHFKKIRDERTGVVTKLAGGYAQLGSFLNEWWPTVPAPLEVVGRFALVDPNRARGSDLQKEWTLGVNWYFNGHRNKLTLDYSWLNFEDPLQDAARRRLRLQWELSI